MEKNKEPDSDVYELIKMEFQAISTEFSLQIVILIHISAILTDLYICFGDGIVYDYYKSSRYNII